MKDTASDPRYRPLLKVLIDQRGEPISLDEISDKSSFSVATVKRHLHSLRAIKVVECNSSKGRGRRSKYYVDPLVERLVTAS